MRALFRVATIGVLGLLACDGPVGPRSTGRLALRTQRLGAATLPVDRGQITLSGPTPGTKSVTPGQTVTFDNLDPGTYNITVESFSGSTLVELGRTNGVSVTAGQTSQATIPLQVLPPPQVRLADQDVAKGTTVTLSSGLSNPSSTLTYTWTQISGPQGPWTGPWTGPTPTFTAPADVTTLQYQLVISDGNMAAPADTGTVWVLQDAAHAIWVSPTGNDGHAGTRAAPMATMQAAMDSMAKRSTTGGAVYVAAGTYAQTQSLVLHHKVSVFGGFNATSFLRDVANNATVINGAATAVTGNGADTLTLDGLTIHSANATAAGASSIGIALASGPAVVISHNVITAGNAAAGQVVSVAPIVIIPPPTSRNGRPGLPGSPGAAGAVALSVVGGAGGDGGCQNPNTFICQLVFNRWNYGGDGGSGTDGAGNPGLTGVGGAPGGGGAAGASGQNGGAGAAGASAQTGGTSFGSMTVSGTYAPATGPSGSTGVAGSGGGGGGGGAGVTIVTLSGGGGGGGGGGGSAGFGAPGGGGGGGSFGIVVVGASTNVAITNNTITTGNGGVGQAGAAGGTGGQGGGGGGGGLAGITTVGFITFTSGPGAAGGNGGAGGVGGGGAGGGGGPTIGIFEDVSSSTILTANTVTLGSAGSGGAGGLDGAGANRAPSGAAGVSVVHQKS